MLTNNVSTEAGLNNGALGYVRDILYNVDNDPYNDILPIGVVVEIDSVADGVTPFVSRIPRTLVIPLQTVRWQTKTCKWVSRSQVPLRLAWAITIHKSQGETLKLAVVHLGKSEKCSGLSLVALSRVKDLRNMLI